MPDTQSTEMRTCCGCARSYVLSETQFTAVHGGRQVCHRCRDYYYLYSTRLDTWVRNADAAYVYGLNAYTTLEDARANYFYCEESGNFHATAEAAEEEGLQIAEDRRREEAIERAQNCVYGYHVTNPIDTHGWPRETKRESLCMGVELEMEHKELTGEREGQQELTDALGTRDGFTDTKAIAGRYILMRDGSLAESGVELITNPYTLEFHQSRFGWQELLARVVNIGQSGAGTKRCGMHVHVNRLAISALTLGKMLVFVNSEKNKRLVIRIAQRNPDEWASLIPKKLTDGKKQESDKYEALHLTRRTIEFRIFRGNLRWDRVLKNIEFCHSVVSYCKTASMQNVEGHTDYLRWLGKHRGTYPNLVKFLGETYGFKLTTSNKATEEV